MRRDDLSKLRGKALKTYLHYAHSAAILEAPRQRRCIRCLRMFPSAWAGNRVCFRCKGRRIKNPFTGKNA